MSRHVLLNLFNQLGEIDKMRGSSSIISLFSTSFINSIKVSMIKKYHDHTQQTNPWHREHHYITLLNLYIDFNTWRYIRGDSAEPNTTTQPPI